MKKGTRNNMGLFNKQKTEDKKSSTEVKSNKKTKVTASEKTTSMKDLYQSSGAVKPVDGTKQQEKAIGNFQLAHRILIKPLVTEKATNLVAENKYVFAVAISANKIEIAKAIQQVYAVKPLNIRVIRMEGKQTRYGRTKGKRKDWKKAIVALPKGATIKVYEGV